MADVRETETQVSLSLGQEGVGQTRQEAEAEDEASSLWTCLQGKTWPKGTLGGGGTYRESGSTQKNPNSSSYNQGVEGVLGGACVQSWFSPGLPESPRPPSAWAPVAAAGEAGAQHLPVGRPRPWQLPCVVPSACPCALGNQGGGPRGPFWWGGVLGDRAPQHVPRPRLGEAVQGDHERLCPTQLTMAPKS